MRKFFYSLIAIVLLVGTVAAEAEARRYHHGGHGIGAPCLFLGVGLLGLAGGAAIASMAADDDKEEANCSSPCQEPPPRGRWVEIPGQWYRGVWVPAHREWHPY